MEFFLDVSLIRGILEAERQRGREDIAQQGPMRAFASSLQRHDTRIAAAADVGSLACRPGCTWCCYFTVDVRPVEVFSILDFIEQNFTPVQRAELGERLRANSVMLRGLAPGERVTLNLKCPFLSEDRCSIYAVRPQSCRNYHATDAAGCRLSYEQPGNLDIDPDFAPAVYQVGGAQVEAFSTAMREAGYDTDAYELNSALDAALSEGGARQRFEAQHKPFATLSGEEVAAEFEDLEP